jgi:hypothetical protein
MKAKRRQRQPPDGEIRRSQMIGTYGPGALVDLLDHAVLVGGLDFWNYPGNQVLPVVPEPRLREKLMERLRELDPPIQLSAAEPFRSPPAGDDQDPAPWNGVQALEFPDWFVCQNPDCRALALKTVLERKHGGRYFHACGRDKLSETVPVRFVAACRNGHVEDFPWIPFAHPDEARGNCPSPRLRLDQGATGDFSEIRVACHACGSSQALSRALIHELGLPCRGHRPWLGGDGREDCDERLRLLVRTASNAYFSQVVSALSIPDPLREIEERVRSVWDVLANATAETLPTFRTIHKVMAAIAGFSDADVLATVKAIQRQETPERPPIRTAEIRQLRAQPEERPGELPRPEDDFFARRYLPADGLPPGIGRLTLAHKLREVRVQVGFTRLEPVTPDLQGEFDLGVQSQRLGLATDWLPASEIRGEGVLIELDEPMVRAWEDRPEVIERDRELQAGFDAWVHGLNTERSPVYPGIRFYLLHSLSHLLITAVSLHCGYPSASIRERLYCASRADDEPMAGILLSTGTAGTEGTLGGLVEEGRRFRRHLKRALEMGSLCANDPVCGAHTPRGDYAERFLEGAACHGCLFIAEPSCERFNLFLDRALVVPTLGQDPRLAFFEPPSS